MFKTIQIIVMAALCLNLNSRAQSPQTLPLPKKQAILGKVVSSTTGEALPGAVVKVIASNHTTVSNDRGEFILAISNGTYNLTVTDIGYETKKITIQIPLKEQLVIALDNDDLLSKTSKAQSQINNIKPLKVGDTIPESLWNTSLQVVNHSDGKDTITLSDYRGKLIILDFWATWCGSCISAMPKIYELQKQFNKNVLILPVTSESEEKAGSFLKENKTLAVLNLTSIVNDTLLNQNFPHKLIPHEVWIGFDGVVRAITADEEINGINILRMMNERNVRLPSKIDVLNFNKELPLFTYLKGAQQVVHYQSTYTGYLNGIGSMIGHRKDSLHRRIFAYNCCILQLYEYATIHQMSGNYILKIKDKQLVNYPDGKDKHYTNENTLWCYELIVPVNCTPSQMRELMLADLNRYSGYIGRLEKRITKLGQPEKVIFILSEKSDY